MKIYDVLNSDECKPLFKEIQEFVKISLSDYNEAIEKEGFSCSDKDIFDFVWGTVNFNAAEVCVLDSPLLQRLRRIRQLGLASMVYCNADSSRFSHTIGVTEVASRMAQTLKNRLGYSDSTFDPVELVRLAAIFHDTGHMFYSHVSELFFTYDKQFPRYNEITALKTYFCNQTSSNASLHEIISVMIVYSPETLRLFKNISLYFPNSKLKNEKHYLQLAEYISCLIIGSPIDKFILPYSMVINSSIDADKLDYLSRDSACTKVPIAVDIARIIQKLDVVDTKEVTKSSIWNDTSLETKPLKIMAIKSSAKKVFWQLSNARNSLFESVYHHHKVLTAETMFRSALNHLYAQKDKPISFCDLMLLTDDAFNEYWKFSPVKPEEIQESDIAVIDNILKRIRERALYKRVAVFSIADLNGNLSNIGQFFRNVVQNSNSKEFLDFKRKLQEEYYKILAFLNDGFKKPDTDPVFMFITSKHESLSSVPFESGDGYCTWSSSLMKNETIEDGKKSRQEQFYLITDCRERHIVYLALEKVLVQYGITFKGKDATMCLKIEKEDFERLRFVLLEKNYYKDALFLITDDIFYSLLDNRKINSVLEKYQTYSGAKSCKITKDSLLKYLKQFLWLQLDYVELKVFLNGILALLDSAYYIDRDTFTVHMNKLLEKMSQTPYKKKHIANLGNSFDSSKHLMYFFNDIKDKKDLIFDTSLENALQKLDEDECLCFFDDGAYSGRQVVSIFQELMGVPKENRSTDEEHCQELSEEDKSRLKHANIILSYLCFNTNSEEYIKSELKKIGIEKVQICFVENLNKSIFEKVQFTDDNQTILVKTCLSKIGEQIMESIKKVDGEYKPRWDGERITKAALGYNDAQQMVIFSNNVPTYTITAFWQNGVFGTNPWIGLFQRTDK